MIRIVENNDWVVITLLLVVAMFLAMFNWLQRDVPFLKFLVQSNQESQNTFLCWLIISLGFSVSLSVLLSQYIPILPRFIEERELFGFTLNKMGLMLTTVLLYKMLITLFTAFFYMGIGQGKRLLSLVFLAQKFYLVQTILFIVLAFVHYYFPIDKKEALNYYLVAIALMVVAKNIFYIFHRESPLPREWYYKILYICTLQILPLLVVWKFIFL